jgi:hypothetical protein
MTIKYVYILIYYYVKCAWSNKSTIKYNTFYHMCLIWKDESLNNW